MLTKDNLLLLLLAAQKYSPLSDPASIAQLQSFFQPSEHLIHSKHPSTVQNCVGNQTHITDSSSLSNTTNISTNNTHNDMYTYVSSHNTANNTHIIISSKTD